MRHGGKRLRARAAHPYRPDHGAAKPHHQAPHQAPSPPTSRVVGPACCPLQGDFEELVGYEEDCGPDSLPEVGSDLMDPLLTAGLGAGVPGGTALPPTDSAGVIG